MRITVLTTSYPRHAEDDAGIFVKRLVDALGEIGGTGTVLVPRDAAEPEEEIQGKFSVTRFSYGLLGRGTLAFGNGIVPKLRRRPWLVIDALHLINRMARLAQEMCGLTDLIHANWIGAGVAAWLVYRRTGTPYVVTLRGEDARLLEHPLLRRLLLPILRNARAVTVVNAGFLELLQKQCGLPAESCACIANGAEIIRPSLTERTAFMTRGGWRKETKYLVFVGTITPRKRVELLIDALPGLARLGYELILCGRTDDTAYLATLNARLAPELRERVHFMGAVPPADIPSYLALATGYVSAAEFEGRPNAVLEALAIGLPAYVSNIPAHREVVQAGLTGAFFSTAADLVAALEQPIPPFTPPSQRTWRMVAEEYLACFQKALAVQ